MPRPLGMRKREQMMMAYLAVPSVQRVARVCGVTRDAVRKYRGLDRWAEREKDLREALIAAGMETLESVRHDLDGMAKAILDRFKQEAAEGLIKAESVADLIRLGEFRLMLRGETTVNIGVKTLPSGKPVTDATREELDEAAAILQGETEHYQKRLAILDERDGGGNGKSKLDRRKVIDMEREAR